MAKSELILSAKPRWWFYPFCFYPIKFFTYAARALGFAPDLSRYTIAHLIKRGTILRIGNRVVPWT
jgi:hypothetical protein